MDKPLTLEEREQASEFMCRLIHELVVDNPEAKVKLDIKRGLTQYDFAGIGSPMWSDFNGTATFTIKINGGAVNVNIDGRVTDVEW